MPRVDNYVQVGFSEAQLAALRLLAESKGLSLAAFVRMVALDALSEGGKLEDSRDGEREKNL